MPIKDPEAARIWRREHKRELRLHLRDLREAMPLHRRLGIRTKVHRQAVTDYVGGSDRETGAYWSPHCYRASVTLAAV